jgi:hypothetical protein
VPADTESAAISDAYVSRLFFPIDTPPEVGPMRITTVMERTKKKAPVDLSQQPEMVHGHLTEAR